VGMILIHGIYSASAWGYIVIVRLLIMHGCKYAAKNTAGWSPADWAYSSEIRSSITGGLWWLWWLWWWLWLWLWLWWLLLRAEKTDKMAR
jgi:hypothetical protein